MRKNVTLGLLFVLLILSVVHVSAQSPADRETFYDKFRRTQDEENIRRNVEKSFQDLRQIGNSQSSVYSSNYRPQKTNEIKNSLEIDQADISNNESFLKNQNTGIFKLLPFSDCSSVVEKEDCYRENLNVGAFANAYSFRDDKHTELIKADLSVSQNSLATSKNSVQSILVNLGDVPLNGVDSMTPGMSFLVNYKPQTSSKKINQQYEEIEKGVKVNEFTYTKSLPIKENTTYVLRSIAYSDSTISPGENADVITAFKIIRANPNGEITVLWKELSRKKGLRVRN